MICWDIFFFLWDKKKQHKLKSLELFLKAHLLQEDRVKQAIVVCYEMNYTAMKWMYGIYGIIKCRHYSLDMQQIYFVSLSVTFNLWFIQFNLRQMPNNNNINEPNNKKKMESGLSAVDI